MRYVYGRDERGTAIDVSDPLAPRFAALAAVHRDDPAGFARALFGLEAMFGTDLPRDARFTEAVVAWLLALFELGAAGAVQQCNARV